MVESPKTNRVERTMSLVYFHYGHIPGESFCLTMETRDRTDRGGVLLKRNSISKYQNWDKNVSIAHNSPPPPPPDPRLL